MKRIDAKAMVRCCEPTPIGLTDVRYGMLDSHSRSVNRVAYRVGKNIETGLINVLEVKGVYPNMSIINSYGSNKGVNYRTWEDAEYHIRMDKAQLTNECNGSVYRQMMRGLDYHKPVFR